MPKSDKKFKSSKIISGLTIAVIFGLSFFVFLFPARASGIDGLSNLGATGNESNQIFSVALESGDPDLSVECVMSAGMEQATSQDLANLTSCLKDTADRNDQTIKKETLKQLNALQDKRRREELWAIMKEKAREVLAIAFKTSLNVFSRTVAHDTAVWVASGGRGQKPLFITEGWGAYLENAADSALGDFIDGVGTSFGMDLCQPNFQVKLAIKAGLDYTRQRQVRCSFSEIMTNWENAINNASFSVEYKDALRPGANDISFALIMADERNAYVDWKTKVAEKDAETTGLWKDIKNIAGKILTPGTVIANTFRDEQSKADLGYSTFTNTAADIVEEFFNTLVSQLLKNLQSGMFSGSGSSGGYGNLPNLSGLSALFNPDSSPIVAGIKGAKLAFSKLIESQTKVGGNIDILLKLSTCPDSAKANPGPTDCVLDSRLAEAIRNKRYVIDLDESIKNRVFAPQINAKDSLDTVISSRGLMIMRKYRIVPIGWEFAAEAIKNAATTKNYTLGEIMDCFYGAGLNGCTITDVDFKGFIDPYWVLKVPEVFCRRIGYTGF
ncbi:MAG: hypothetical protein WC517_04955, partial [Patescibacteria group bacterium]